MQHFAVEQIAASQVEVDIFALSIKILPEPTSESTSRAVHVLELNADPATPPIFPSLFEHVNYVPVSGQHFESVQLSSPVQS